MDIVIKKNDKNILVANEMSQAEIDQFVFAIQAQHNVQTLEVDSNSIDWNKINVDNVVRIMPHNKYKKNEIKYTIMAI